MKRLNPKESTNGFTHFPCVGPNNKSHVCKRDTHDSFKAGLEKLPTDKNHTE